MMARCEDPGFVDRLDVVGRQVAATDDLVELGELSFQFMATTVDAAHSPRIKVVLRAMPPLVPGDFFAEVPAAADVQRRGIAAIMRAVRRGEADRAAEEYVRMMRRVGDKVVAVFGSRGLFDAAA